MTKTALVTGVTGQDGSYLAELLLSKGYEVHGIIRKNSDFTSKRINPFYEHENFVLHHGDMTDGASLFSVLSEVKPHEIYNLAAQSHVGLSFKLPEYSSNVDALGVLRLMTCVKELNLNAKIYQASTSELFGGEITATPQNELTPFKPRSPYAIAKLFAYWIVKNYREAYGMYACNGILFNHESPRRGKTFVTKKITQAVARYAHGDRRTLKLGNLNAKRDWGYAKEYMEAVYLMMQQDHPDDFVIGTGKMYSVREFVEKAFYYIGTEIIWQDQGINERGYSKHSGELLIEIDPQFYRPTEVEVLCADASKAEECLHWKPQTEIDEIVKMMVNYDLKFEEYGYPDLTEPHNLLKVHLSV